eukprot:6571491-Pyramimonas_sp.AAC.1
MHIRASQRPQRARVLNAALRNGCEREVVHSTWCNLRGDICVLCNVCWANYAVQPICCNLDCATNAVLYYPSATLPRSWSP